MTEPSTARLKPLRGTPSPTVDATGRATPPSAATALSTSPPFTAPPRPLTPLVPLTRENGATEIFPRTQLPWVHITDPWPEYFCADVGEAVVMDQRCYHRGKANFSTEDRPAICR